MNSRTISILLFLSIYCGFAYSQPSWVWQNPLPTGNHLNAIFFTSSAAGFIGGDALNYPSGIYFYRLETNNFAETKRMILIK